MPKPVRDIPPPLELLCLNALWSLREANVADVRRVVAQTRPLAYTTIMTVLERLARKGMASRRKAGRAFVYSPQASRDVMRRAAIRELVNGFFGGSEEELLRFLQEGKPQTAAAAAGAGLPQTPADERIDTVLL